jgi:hypothetical protein
MVNWGDEQAGASHGSLPEQLNRIACDEINDIRLQQNFVTLS